eukprot:74056_1
MAQLLNSNLAIENGCTNYGTINTHVKTRITITPPTECISSHHFSTHPESITIPLAATRTQSESQLQHSPRKTPNLSPYFHSFSPALTSRSAIDAYSPSSRCELDDLINVDSNKITSWQAGFTICNLFLGLCLLSYPYALACGSFSSLVAFIFICFALCYTGKLIVRCFDILSDDVEQSYPMVGYYSFQNAGYLLISIGIMSELLGALCTNTIFLWTNLAYLLTPYGLSQDMVILVCSVITLPTCWMLNFSELSINSLLGCICKVFTAIVVFVTFFLNLDDVQQRIAQSEIKIFPTNVQSFCISIGIYIMSFSGHPCLPGIYRSMKDPKQFERVLDWCFVVMSLSYIMISVFGYLTFGENTNIIITGNLLSQNVYLSKTLIILVVAGCYFQVSPLIAVMAEIPENNIFKWQYASNIKFKSRLFRTCVFLSICAVSYVCMDKLAFLEAITGSICTMIVSVICPALFYHKLFLTKKAKRKVFVPHASRSDGDLNHSIKKIDFVQASYTEREKHYRDMALSVILYLYVICGTIFGIYMFATDVMNAMT